MEATQGPSQPSSTRQVPVVGLCERLPSAGPPTGSTDSWGNLADDGDKKDDVEMGQLEEEPSMVTDDEDTKEKDIEARLGEVTKAPPFVPPPFPDGGAQAYRTTLGGVLVLFSTFGTSNSFGAFQAEYANNQLRASPPSSISWIGSAHLAIAFSCALPSGRLFDNGYFRYQLAFGSALWFFGVMMLSLSKTYVQIFLSHSVCLGLGLGIVFTPTLSVVGSYFKARRTLMMGCTAGGAGLGAVLYPIMLNKLFPRIGFGPSIRAMGYMHLGCLLVANCLMRPRILPVKPRIPAFPQIAAFLRQPATWFVSGGSALVMLGIFVPIFYIQVYAKSHDADTIVVDYVVAILNAAAVVSRLLIGLVADRWGVLNTAIPVTLVTGGLLVGVTNNSGIIAYAVLYGLWSGCWISLMAPGFLSLAQDVSELGVRGGLGFIFCAVSTLVGSPIAGALLAAGHGYTAPCVFAGGVTLMGTALLVLGRQSQTKRRKTQRV